MALPKTIKLRELGPREGFQTLSKVVPTEEKLALIELLSETGVGLIEVTSLVRPDKVPQMADAEEVINRISPRNNLQYTALYLNIKGFERGEELPNISNEGWLYSSPSESFLKNNNNCTVDDTVSKIPEWVSAFKKRGKDIHGVVVSTAFGCIYEGEISPEKTSALIRKISSKVDETGSKLKEVCLADTVGRGNPETVRKLTNLTRETVPHAEVSLHLHDTRGTGMANAYAGLLEGIEIFEASVGGMGGCPFAKGAAGNIPSEDLLYMCNELGIAIGGISLEKYVEAAKYAEKIVGYVLPGKYYKAAVGKM